MSKLSEKINPWNAERIPAQHKQDFSKDILVDAGQLPKGIPVQTSSVDEDGVKSSIWFDTTLNVWKMKRVNRNGQLLQEVQAASREELVAKIVSQADAVIAANTFSVHDRAYASWIVNYPGGRHFDGWLSRLCEEDQSMVAQTLARCVRAWYGEGAMNDPDIIEKVYRHMLDTSDYFDVYMTHSENLRLAALEAAEPKLADTPHSQLRKVDDTERLRQDKLNRSRDLKDLKHAAIPALNRSQDTTRERMVETRPTGASRKL